MEQLAAKYDFRFVGSSITRRLAESFVSIYTGEASPHPAAHKRQDFSSGNLTVGFLVGFLGAFGAFGAFGAHFYLSHTNVIDERCA